MTPDSDAMRALDNLSNAYSMDSTKVDGVREWCDTIRTSLFNSAKVDKLLEALERIATDRSEKPVIGTTYGDTPYANEAVVYGWNSAAFVCGKIAVDASTNSTRRIFR